jgi:TolC family type I secretion outer membrane protein
MKLFTTAILLTTCLTSSLFGAEIKKTDAFKQALIDAYKTNPDFARAAAEYQVQLSNEAIAMAEFMPQLDLSGNYNNVGKQDFKYTDEEKKANPGLEDSEKFYNREKGAYTWDLGLTARLNIFKGFASIAKLNQTQFGILAQAAALKSAEAEILNSAIESYMSCLTNQKALESYVVSEQSMETNYKAAKTQFQVGSITQSELLQAQAKYEAAKAQRISGEGDLENSRAAYQKVIGSAPGNLNFPNLPKDKLPKTLEEASELTMKRFPKIIQAQFAEKAANEGWQMGASAFMPSIDLTAGYKKNWTDKDDKLLGDQSPASSNPVNSISYSATARWNLFDGLASSGRFAQEVDKIQQAKMQLESTRRAGIELVTKSWRALISARDEINAQQAAVAAASLALEGLRQGARLGAFSMLQVFETEDTHVKAQVALAKAKQKEVMATFNLLAATGSLSAKELGLIEIEKKDE